MPIIENELGDLIRQTRPWVIKGWEFLLTHQWFEGMGVFSSERVMYRAMFMHKAADIQGPISDEPEETVRELLKKMEQHAPDLEK